MDKDKTRYAIKLLLESFGEDLNREGIKSTPFRVADFYEKALSGSFVDPMKIISTQHYVSDNYNDVVLIKDIVFYSLCEHHLLPFFGNIHIAYIPKNNKVIGISNFLKLVQVFANRLQLQEKFTKQITDTIVKCIKPKGIMVIVKARHLCMIMHNSNRTSNSKLVTLAIRGIFLKKMKMISKIMSTFLKD
ncbi:MAG: GTP cyclohydrolase I [Endomicrobium sp.]|nr:GTP cyclohydrolase I [Endomicrobium sp.]